MPSPFISPQAPFRPPVRRRVKVRRRRAGNYYLRLALLVTGGLAGAYVVSLFLIKAIHPYKLGYEEAQKIAGMRETLRNQTAENEALRKRVAYLNTPEGAEVEARRAGWQKPGETVYLMSKPENSQNGPPLP